MPTYYRKECTLAISLLFTQKDETIESMVERGKQMKDMTGASFIGDEYFDSLQQCELVKMFVTIAYK